MKDFVRIDVTKIRSLCARLDAYSEKIDSVHRPIYGKYEGGVAGLPQLSSVAMLAVVEKFRHKSTTIVSDLISHMHTVRASVLAYQTADGNA